MTGRRDNWSLLYKAFPVPVLSSDETEFAGPFQNQKERVNPKISGTRKEPLLRVVARGVLGHLPSSDTRDEPGKVEVSPPVTGTLGQELRPDWDPPPDPLPRPPVDI